MERVPTDLRALVVECAAHLLVQAGKGKSLAAARQQAEDCLNSGAPRQKWDEMIVAQGANLKAFNRKLALDCTAPVVLLLKAKRAGFVSECDARLIGEVIRDLGGGRLAKESVINHEVGVDHLAKPGDSVKPGDVLVRVHAASRAEARTACARLEGSFEISTRPPRREKLVQGIITR